MTTTNSHLVLDASVAVKWYLPDEPDADAALALLNQFEAGAVRFTAPTQILYEVASAITLATTRTTPRLSSTAGERSLRAFLKLALRAETTSEMLDAAFGLSRQLQIAFYDATYVALSQRLGIPLITADRKLHSRIRQLPGVLWITEWS